MAIICPTVLADNPHTFREQIERVQDFATRIHLDFTDGDFASNKTVELTQAWLPDNIQTDLHLMYKHPENDLQHIVKLKPSLVIVHAEAEGDFVHFAATLMQNDVKVGLALLADTPVSKIEPVLPHINHVLIFSGDLGHFGGTANLELLDKVEQIKAINSELEIGWDGGVNEENAKQLAENGIDVLNVGGFIQRAEDPKAAFESLESQL